MELDSAWMSAYLIAVKMTGQRVQPPKNWGTPMTAKNVQYAADNAGSALLLALSVVTAVAVMVVGG
jgi:hypothetical protein